MFLRGMFMKFQPLKPWIMGNDSVNPKKFYGKLKPQLEYGAFIGLDICCDLHLANTIDAGNLYDSWNKNRKYIEDVCILTGTNEQCGYDLDNEEKRLVLETLGEPPTGCYNIYFITIYNDYEEKLVYIGKTDAKNSRFANGHLVALKLHHPKYKEFDKRVYFGTIMLLSEEQQYIPLEFIFPYEKARNYLDWMEGFLLEKLHPELNDRLEYVGEMEKVSTVHIQNFTDVSDFMNDIFL